MVSISFRHVFKIIISASTVFGVLALVPHFGSPRAARVYRRNTYPPAARCVSYYDTVQPAGDLGLKRRASAQSAGMFLLDSNGRSRLVGAVTSGKMPPTGRLPAKVIELLTSWAVSGTVYSAGTPQAADPATAPIWSFQPVRAPAAPHSRFDALSKNPVDRFLFVRLAQRGLQPSPLADRRSLLRRVTLDLTGLPPTPEEMTAFLQDKRPDAYERVVDRLLASAAYGERWGRQWLDVVRYGESNGYEQNHVRPDSWPYRDYVINAFNSDIPYPQFIAEQLAGDVLAKENPAAQAATGFLVAGTHDTVGIQTEEGTRQQRSNDLDDIVSTTGAAFLGLTVGCAKCHDHKFDPIPQRDFYRMAACFAGVRHGERPLRVQSDSEKQEEARAAAKLSELQNALNDLDNQARTALLRTRGNAPGGRPAVNARRNEDTFPRVAARFVRFTVLAINDGAEPCIDELQVFGPDLAGNLALASGGAKASASSLLPGYAVHQVPHINDGKLGNDHSWISNTRGNGWVRIELPREQAIDRVVWSRDGAEIPRFDDRLPIQYHIDVSTDGEQWSTVSTEKGRSGSKDYIHPDELKQTMTPEQLTLRESLQKQIAAQNQRIAAQRGIDRAYIGQFSAPEPVFVLRRGDVMQRGEEVPPGALSRISLLSPDLLRSTSAPESERRLALAHWIADPRNPLTPRVLVNRVWQGHFGRGIVGTPSDFGRNGEHPTHPELLDWLAYNFMQPQTDKTQAVVSSKLAAVTPDSLHLAPYSCGWRLKPLHRLIVTSYAYRQTSTANAAGVAKDASNTLLWRMNLRRMEAEAVRDSILATSGKLNRAMGGPSFKLYKYSVVNVAIYEPLESYGPETWRRGVYQQAARGIRDDLLGAFDCPESSQRAPKRESTTTALQALSLLNGPFVLQQAGFFAGRVQKETGENTGAQVQRAFELAFNRIPDQAEQQAAAGLVNRTGLPALCRALLNANEFLYY